MADETKRLVTVGDALARVREMHAKADAYFEENDVPGAWLDEGGSWKDWESEAEGSAAESRRDAFAEVLALFDAMPERLAISVGEGSSSWFADTARTMHGWMVRVVPREGEPFDGKLIPERRTDRDFEWLDAVRVVPVDENDEPAAGSRMVRVEELHVY